MEHERLGRLAYFLTIARAAALRSTCPRKSVGAVVVVDNVVVSTGYNGAPSGWGHCLDQGCLLYRDGEGKDRCLRVVHAEANALLRVPPHIKHPILFSTSQPCYYCYLLACARGVQKIFFEEPFVDPARDALIRDPGHPEDANWMPTMDQIEVKNPWVKG